MLDLAEFFLTCVSVTLSLSITYLTRYLENTLIILFFSPG